MNDITKDILVRRRYAMHIKWPSADLSSHIQVIYWS